MDAQKNTPSNTDSPTGYPKKTIIVLSVFLSLLTGYLLGNVLPIPKVQEGMSNKPISSQKTTPTAQEFVPVCDRAGGNSSYNAKVVAHDTAKKTLAFDQGGTSYDGSYCDNVVVIDGNSGKKLKIEDVKPGAVVNTESNNFKILKIEIIN